MAKFFTFEKKITMKNWLLGLILIAGLWAFYEQSKPQPNKISLTVAILLLMFGLMKLMKKIPDKDDKNNE